MKIGLYSELARAPIVRARAQIAARGYGVSSPEIRKFRQEIEHFLDAETVSTLLASPDFYSMSGCRDLVFHVQEHRFTLPQIAVIIAGLRLDFLGFEPQPSIGPRGEVRRDLSRWHEFEIGHPYTFKGMYQFWLRHHRW
jgi:hypothetical protein